MAHVVLFHSVLGLRPAEREIAAALEADGNSVSLPDLFDGRTADTYDAGFGLKDEVGDEAIKANAQAALERAPDDAVLSGVSFGAFLIGEFWGARPKMPGALLFAGVAPWMANPPSGLRVAAHVARPDPFDDEAFFTEWLAGSGDTSCELHRYDGVGHYFLDRTLPDFDAAATDLCLERSRAFLRGL